MTAEEAKKRGIYVILDLHGAVARLGGRPDVWARSARSFGAQLVKVRAAPFAHVNGPPSEGRLSPMRGLNAGSPGTLEARFRRSQLFSGLLEMDAVL